MVTGLQWFIYIVYVSPKKVNNLCSKTISGRTMLVTKTVPCNEYKWKKQPNFEKKCFKINTLFNSYRYLNLEYLPT